MQIYADNDSPRGVTARPSWIVSTRANTSQGERKGAKGAKVGKTSLTADLRRLSQIKIYSPQRRRKQRATNQLAVGSKAKRLRTTGQWTTGLLTTGP